MVQPDVHISHRAARWRQHNYINVITIHPYNNRQMITQSWTSILSPICQDDNINLIIQPDDSTKCYINVIIQLDDNVDGKYLNLSSD